MFVCRRFRVTGVVLSVASHPPAILVTLSGTVAVTSAAATHVAACERSASDSASRTQTLGSDLAQPSLARVPPTKFALLSDTDGRLNWHWHRDDSGLLGGRRRPRRRVELQRGRSSEFERRLEAGRVHPSEESGRLRPDRPLPSGRASGTTTGRRAQGGHLERPGACRRASANPWLEAPRALRPRGGTADLREPY